MQRYYCFECESTDSFSEKKTVKYFTWCFFYKPWIFCVNCRVLRFLFFFTELFNWLLALGSALTPLTSELWLPVVYLNAVIQCVALIGMSVLWLGIRCMEQNLSLDPQGLCCSWSAFGHVAQALWLLVFCLCSGCDSTTHFSGKREPTVPEKPWEILGQLIGKSTVLWLD